ncbi:MAG TPA: serine/threonine-protein kinase [Ktedonobacteraceae bacterium]|nr:serine/threonine-protein kinase [Ktedonobacteraceae bacterium]
MKEQHGPIMEDQSRARFGNYDLIRPIDTGGMGEVYLAHQRSAFGRPVAIKIIRSDLVHDTTARARFLREAEVSAHLKHEHILPLFEFGEDQGRLFLVTPYIDGGTLARRLQSGSLSLAEVRQLFVPLVQAVAYIHRRGVVHRDLKPTNILLDEQDGQIYVRLIDFGIATVQGRTASPPLTMAGNEVGTLAYMAPERLNGIAAPSNDIFSLGVILHQMLTGNLPLGEELDPLPGPLDYVVRRCIAERPEERFASAEEVLKNFERAYQAVTSPPPALPGMPSLSLDPAMTGHVSGRLAAEQTPLESISLQHSGQLPVVSPLSPIPALSGELPAISQLFSHEDYGAPTTSFEPAKMQSAPAPLARPPRNTGGRHGKRSLMPLIWAIMIVVLLAIGGLAYYGYQAVTATAVTINFGPKVQPISQVDTLTATTRTQSVDVNNAIIPLKGLTDNQSSSRNGPTTGLVNCNLFGCQQGVSPDDVNGLVAQMQPGLESNIRDQLKQAIAKAGGMAVTAINVTIVSIISNPAIGQPGDTVTVTLNEQGSVGYIVNADATSVARALLARQVKQMGANYSLLSTTVVLGRPTIEKVDRASGQVTIKIAAGGDVLYQFPASEIQAMRTSLKSKTVTNARTYLANQPGVDPNTIVIHFTQGTSTTLPDNIQNITIVPLNASVYPAVHLQAVSTPAILSTPTDATPPPSSPTATQTDHGDGD